MSDYLKRLHITDVEDTGENIGAYMKRVHIVEVVDSDGNPWEPVPGPDPWDELVVVSKSTWSDGNVYAVGETISGVSATFTGGSDNIKYRSRVQHKPVGEANWINSGWTNHTNSAQSTQFTIPAGYENGQVRFQTQAKDDGQDPVIQVNSFTSVQSIAPLEWGAITTEINDQPYDANEDGAYPCAANTPQHCVVSVANAPSDITYEWSKRGTDNVLIGTPSNHTTTITFPDSGVFTVTVSLKSNKTAEWESAILTFMVA